MRIALSSAHGKVVHGARGIIDEVDESRRVVVQVARDLHELGVEFVTFDDDVSRTQQANLRAINAWHNRQQRDLDVSIHFNMYHSTDAPRGVEVLYATQHDLAARMSSAIAIASGLINRGAKLRKLSFLRGTSKPAILIEICFTDSRADVDLYQINFDRICKAIADTLAHWS